MWSRVARGLLLTALVMCCVSLAVDISQKEPLSYIIVDILSVMFISLMMSGDVKRPSELKLTAEMLDSSRDPMTKEERIRYYQVLYVNHVNQANIISEEIKRLMEVDNEEV